MVEFKDLSKENLSKMRCELYGLDFECLATSCKNCPIKKDCDELDSIKARMISKLVKNGKS